MNLESIIQNLSSPVKNKTLRNTNHSVNDILTNTSCGSYYQAKVCESFLRMLKKLNLNKKYTEFHTLLNDIFSKEQLVDILFLKWLSQILNMRTGRFIETVRNWHIRGCEETRGRKDLSDEIRQSVYTWIEHSTNSTGGRNGRNAVKITKLQYLRFYSGLNENIKTEERVRGSIQYIANRVWMDLYCKLHADVFVGRILK